MVFSHALVGSIVTRELTKDKKLTPKQLSIAYFVGIVGSVLPDFDTVALIFDNSLSHREFLTHSFIPYMLLAIVGLFIAVFKKGVFLKTVLAAFIIGTIGHIVLDFFYGGVVALAPFDYTRYGIEMNFKFTSRYTWARSYFTSKFFLGEILVLGFFLFFMKNIKNKIGKYLPIIFVVGSFLMLAVITFK